MKPDSAPCEHDWECGLVGVTCHKCGEFVTNRALPVAAQGRWRPCYSELPTDECTYNARNEKGTKRVVRRVKGVWQIALSIDSVFCHMDAPTCWRWFDPGAEQGADQRSAGSESNAATSARCTDAEAVAGGAARHAGSIPAHSATAHQRGEAILRMTKFHWTRPFGSRE
jgi:hypothetical protein